MPKHKMKMPKHKLPKHKMKVPKHKMKMPKHKMPLPSKFDHLFSNKRSMGILPAGSISHNLLSSTTTPSPPQEQHQQQFCNNNKLKLLVIHGDWKSPCVSLLSTEEEEEEDDDTLTIPDFDCPVASCHKLLLTVRDEYDDDEGLVLWNPSTKVETHLPRPPRPPPSVEYELNVVFYGLGLDPKSNDDEDYKVIRFLEFNYGGAFLDEAGGFMGYEVVELYSLKTDSWKQIPYPHANHGLSPSYDDPIYINGFNYWTAGTGPGNEDLVIVSFDFAEERFPSALIPGPPNESYKLDDLERHHFLLAEFKGLLALAVYDKHYKLLELWVWNNDDESWSKRGVWAIGVDVFNPLAFLKNRLFYFENSLGELVIFDCATQKLRKNFGVCAVRPPFFGCVTSCKSTPRLVES